MSSLRLDIEQAMGLKFPEKNGEPLVKFEESMEVPRAAEALMRGAYRDPDRVRGGFQTLHQETAAILDILLPRRSRLREWTEELPERPQEAESFLRDTSEQLAKKEQRLIQAERELLGELQASGLNDVFPLSLGAFGICVYREPSVKIFLRPLGRLAEMQQLNPEHVRQAVRVHFLCQLLVISGLDLDGQSYARAGEDPVLPMLAGAYSLRYLKKQSPELARSYNEWLKAWGGKNIPHAMLNDQMAEKIRAAMVFWRRQASISWDECWAIINQLEKSPIQDNYFERKNFM